MFKARLVAVSLIAVIALSGVSVCMADDSSAYEGTNGQYGDVREVSYAQFDSACVNYTGKSFSQWISFLFGEFTDYSIDIHEPSLESKIAMTRDTRTDGSTYVMNDRMTGYLEMVFDSTGVGHFPDAGTYQAQEDENAIAFIKRVFLNEGGAAERTVNVTYDIRLYIDAVAVTTADLSTGEIKDSQVNVRFALYDKEHRDIDIDLGFDEKGNLETMVIDYLQTDVNNNFYLDMETGLTVEGMDVFSESDRELDPMFTGHVSEFLISSDLADSVWLDVILSGGVEIGNTNLAELILKILGSGGRTLDLFDTIKSLTSSDIPDATVTASLNASHYTEDGYDYCKLASKKTGGPAFYFPWGPYEITGEMVKDLIPIHDSDSVLRKVIKNLVIAYFYVDPVEVKDISGDEAMKQQCSDIRDKVFAELDKEEEGSYTIPPVYIAISVVGILMSIILFVQMRGRML